MLKRRCGVAPNDVRPDAQPVRRKCEVADPRLQVSGNGLPRWRRSVWVPREQEVSAVHLHFRAEKVVPGRQNDRAGEGNSVSTSAPVTAGSPCLGLMLFTTVCWAARVGFKSSVEKRSVWLLPFRVAESISTSEGEFSRVGTCGVRLATESSGKW